jgi:hypothetical protein
MDQQRAACARLPSTRQRDQLKIYYMKKICSLLFSALLLAFLFACESEPGNAKIEVYLTDAPGDYQEVNVEIIGVEVHSDEGGQAEGWKTLDVKDGVYDLRELTNGLDTLIGSVELPAGKISQLRLILGTDNSIRVDHATHELGTPSGQQSGLKLLINTVLQEGVTYKVLLDFDVARSIVLKGNNSYSLKPVIRTIVEAQSGAIKGQVTPIDSTPAIYAIAGTDTVGTTFTDETGQFLIRGLAPGSYNISFAPNSAFTSKTVEGVAVVLGEVTDMGNIVME